ncbi:hypothetical protein PG997_003341 [Apiospora hydei]|uniref:Uncharacterized protein n=1 Tax=Apiospora hydei TaxID=1337664 RepID=A0ABR1WZ18_9PEZI
MDKLVHSPSSPYPVYVGFWTNWSQGSVLGSSLTLTQANANLVIAFVAFLVTVSTANLWGIICFTAHHLYSTNEPRDALHHQRQAILRNNGGPFSGLSTLLRLSWAWRKNKRRSLRRLMPLLALTAALMGGFTTASIFAAKIATSSEVLILSSSCGVIGNDNRGRSAVDILQILNPYMSRGVSLAANYAQQCYAINGPPSPLDCGTYVKKNMLFTTTANASCPFDPSICTRTNSSLLLDTGLMDSHDDFGINAPSNERWQFRKTVHCSPLVTNGFTSQYNETSGAPWKLYHYGKNLAEGLNWTYQYPDKYGSTRKGVNISRSNFDYTLSTTAAWYQNGSLDRDVSYVDPIPQLRRSDADLSLYFLSSNDVLFLGNITDDWYRAGRYVGNYPGPSTGKALPRLYVQEKPASVLACVQQQQVCNPNHPSGGRVCTPMSGVADMNRLGYELFDEAGAQRLLWSKRAGFSAQGGPIQTAVQALKLDALQSRRSMVTAYQGPLPDDQWQRDVQYWFQVSLAAWQKGFVDSAAGVSNPDVAPWVQAPNNTEEYKMCESQKIRSSAHASFSVFGLFFIVAACILITTVNMTLESLAACIQKRCRLDPYSRLEWNTNHTLQLQRLAHEGLGLGEWTDCDKAIPVMRAGSQHAELASLDIGEKDHPRLLVRTAAAGCQEQRESTDKRAMASVSERMLGTGDSGDIWGIESVPERPHVTVLR